MKKLGFLSGLGKLSTSTDGKYVELISYSSSAVAGQGVRKDEREDRGFFFRFVGGKNPANATAKQFCFLI